MRMPGGANQQHVAAALNQAGQRRQQQPPLCQPPLGLQHFGQGLARPATTWQQRVQGSVATGQNGCQPTTQSVT